MSFASGGIAPLEELSGWHIRLVDLTKEHGSGRSKPPAIATLCASSWAESARKICVAKTASSVPLPWAIAVFSTAASGGIGV